MNARVASVTIYPVKSCGPIDSTSYKVGPRGFLWDRNWMIIDEATGQFVSQREFPKLATIQTLVTPWSLNLHIPSEAPLDIEVGLETPEAPPRIVRIWNDECLARDEGDEPAQALSWYLDHSVRLVRMEADAKRMTSSGSFPAQTSFSDGFPFTLVCTESLEDLNSKLATAVPMNRFRPNIVVVGAQPFAEDGWKRIRIGEVEFEVVNGCTRCPMINIDQQTGEKEKEPLKTLGGFRKKNDQEVVFGQNLIHKNEGYVRVADEVLILE